MVGNMFRTLSRWLRGKPMPAPIESKEPALAQADDLASASEESHSHPVAYDENLLERSRTQWQFGDWASLAKLERSTLQHHPDRAKLALLAAAGHQQLGNESAARLFMQLAIDWGCDRRTIKHVTSEGLCNTLARIAKLRDQEKNKAVLSKKNRASKRLDHRATAESSSNKSPPATVLTEYLKAKNEPSQDPKVSVIIPFFNANKYIENCLNSLLNQSLKKFEAIFIDDGSNDNSAEQIERLTKNDSRFRIIKIHENQGPSFARNLGIYNARATYLRFMDVDDVLPLSSLESLVAHSKNQDMIRGSFEVICLKEKHLDLATESNILDIHPFSLPLPVRSKAIYGLWATLFNREFLIKNSLKFPEQQRNAEDTFFLAACFFAASRVSVINDIVYQYWKNENSLSNPENPDLAYFKNSLARWFYIKQRAIECGNATVLDAAFHSALDNYLAKTHLPRIQQHLTPDEKENLKASYQMLLNRFQLSFSAYQKYFDSDIP